MELRGVIKVIDDIKSIGDKGFKKRDLVLTTDEQYPQMILIEFIQDKTELLDNFKVGDNVKIAINIKGREWINPEGVAKYFNAIQGWRVERVESEEPATDKS